MGLQYWPIFVYLFLSVRCGKVSVISRNVRKFSLATDHDPEHLVDPLEDAGSSLDNAVTGPITAAEGRDNNSDALEQRPVADSSSNTSLQTVPKILRLESNGTNDTVSEDTTNSATKKVSGFRLWTSEDLWQPLCQNCKALVDYKVILEEYDGTATRISLVVVAVALIWLLGTTAQDFFVPPLLYLCEKLRFPPEIAGATLLALGNGAPDIFAVCTAATKGDLALSVSEMLGSNMFTLCVTGSSIVLVWSLLQAKEDGVVSIAEDEEEEKVMVWRLRFTVLIYVATVLMVAYILMHGLSSIWMALSLPCMYLGYLLMLWMLPSKQAQNLSMACLHGHCSGFVETADGSLVDPPHKEIEPPPPLAGLSIPDDASNAQTLFWVLSLPAYAIRWASIPPVDGKWGTSRRLISSVTPVGVLVFCLFTNVGKIQHLNVITVIGFALLAFVLSAFIFLGSDSRPALPWFYPVLPLIALTSAILWLAMLASEITALVEAIGFFLQVPRMRLGFTAIAWGNSLADLLVCMATVREGHAGMAITAIFAAPLIDDLLAFGMAITLIYFTTGSVPVLCGETCAADLKLPLITSFCFVSISALLLACMLRLKSNRHRAWAMLMFTWYVLFLFLVLFVMKVDAPLEE